MRIIKKAKHLEKEQIFELNKKFIWDTAKGKRVKSDGKRIKQASVDGYTYTQNLLLEFITKTSFDLKIFIAANLTAKETEKAKKYYKKFYTDFTDFLYKDKDLFDNYVSSVGRMSFTNY